MSAPVVDRDEIEYGICGCFACGHGIYDGMVIWRMKSGEYRNRFEGEGSRREVRTRMLIELLKGERNYEPGK